MYNCCIELCFYVENRWFKQCFCKIKIPRKVLNDMIYSRLESLRYLEDKGYIIDYEKMINSLKLLEVKNKEMFEHSVRVAKYSEILAREFFCDSEKIDCIWISALFHDIGKVLVPNYILRNTDSLSEDEFEIIKKHSYDGYKIAKGYLKKELAFPALEHHERLSGAGYPFSKNKLSLETRIVAIIDTFDAMTSERVYQKSLSFKEAIGKLEDLAENKKYYDDEVFKKLKELVEVEVIEATWM